MARIFGLSTLIKTLVKTCNVIAAVRTPIRAFVPDGSLAAYDNALDTIMSACEVIRAIDFVDGVSSTNAPWGQRGSVEG
jgi:hypothetical protein